MPELPEVETIRLGLQKKIIGLTLKNIQILNQKTFQGQESEVEGKKVEKIWRRAKMLGIDLSGDLTILFHLKMTGQLIFLKKEERIVGGHPTQDMCADLPNKSTRVIFEFSDGSRLFFNDQRKFGWVKIANRKSLIASREMQSLGPEPLEKSFTWQILKEKLGKHPKLPVKVALMDQTAVSGIGNIYASEVLFDARIDPRKKVADLADKDYKKLKEGIVRSLQTAIKYGGSTIAHFVNESGERGYFIDYANVYGKAGQTCKGCPGKIQKITQAGRGTYFCPSCQK